MTPVTVFPHSTSAVRPVDFSGDGCAHFQRRNAGVGDDAGLFVDVGDGHATQNTGIGGLAAALGIEGRLVENHLITALAFLAGDNSGGELGEEGVGIEELYGFHRENILSHQEIETTNRHTGSMRRKPSTAEVILAAMA